MGWWLSTIKQFSIARELITNLLLVIGFLKHVFQLFLNPLSSQQAFDIKLLFVFLGKVFISCAF